MCFTSSFLCQQKWRRSWTSKWLFQNKHSLTGITISCWRSTHALTQLTTSYLWDARTPHHTTSLTLYSVCPFWVANKWYYLIICGELVFFFSKKMYGGFLFKFVLTVYYWGTNALRLSRWSGSSFNRKARHLTPMLLLTAMLPLCECISEWKICSKKYCNVIIHLQRSIYWVLCLTIEISVCIKYSTTWDFLIFNTYNI